MPAIPPDLLQRSRRILLPLIDTEDDREALLTEAFYLHDPLLYGIERSGAGKVFAVRCITKLLDYGCLTEGEHALARLLETARYDCGVDKHPEINELVAMVNALCEQAKPPATAPTPTANPAPQPALTQTIETPRDARQPTVFISYSHRDTDFAEQLIQDLQAAGHPCWIDTAKIKGGDEWIMTIAEGINNSYAFVPIVTLKALQSNWVQDEILWARQKNKLIIPLILENIFGETRFFPLVSYQGITVFDSDYASALPRLLSYLPAPGITEASVNPEEIEEEEGEAEAITEAIKVSAPRSIPRKLELAYLDRLQLEELLNTDKYTEMGGVSQVNRKAEMRAVFELLPMGRDREDEPAETRRFENAVEEIQHIRRCVLLGEPGGGKTTTIWKLAAELVARALQDRDAPIPLLVRLGKWTERDQPLLEFIASQLGDLGAYLEELLAEKRAALLLDGLNELPASQHKLKYPQVQRFIKQQADALAVVSCRELDYTIDLGFAKINITPLDPLRIREFAVRYLGAEQGDDLFWKLAGEEANRQYTKFIEKFREKLDEPERVFWLEKQLPEGINWGYRWRDNGNTYWQNWLKEREKPSGLMVLARNPYMLLMLTSVYADEGQLPDNRGQLFAKFVDTLIEREEKNEVLTAAEGEALIKGLLGVAYKMQMQPSDDDEGNALTVLSRADVLETLDERQLYLAGSANILSVGDQVRFTHQLLQEYFAAQYLNQLIFSPLPAQYVGEGQGVRALKATDIWKPESWWERTNWEEAAILLAGLYSDDPTPVVEWLMDAQPELTAWCITRGGAATPPDETLLKLRERWLPRLTDLATDPHPYARAAVGRALGQLTLSNGEALDNRKGVSVIIGDGERIPEIVWCDVDVPEALRGQKIAFEDHKGEVYIETEIEPFRIAKYLVTYEQFQAFVDGDYENDEWWQGFPERVKSLFDEEYPVRELREQESKYANHPRDSVSWYQAVAYTRWLSAKLGYEVRLPTEWEWQWAAQNGLEKREYAWKGEFDSDLCNTVESGIVRSTAVGMYPEGAAGCGALDMSGNLWEWCLNPLDDPGAGLTAEMRSNPRRVLRGGSWYSDHNYARAASRSPDDPYSRDFNHGFRLCCVRAPSL